MVVWSPRLWLGWVPALLVTAGVAGAACRVDREAAFPGDGEKVRLARAAQLPPAANFAVFKAPLAVNTDGAPTSYHPDDFLGERIALNRIDNGISIRRIDGTRIDTAERRRVFDLWRATPDWTVPSGFRITWKNVIAADAQGHPCILRDGPHAGYFGSLTALQNGLSGAAAGQCQIDNQLDQSRVPAIALRGRSDGPLQASGARVGDLVLAVNPESGVAVAAVVGDAGDGNRIGEGSVALNRALLGVAEAPSNYRQALRLDTGQRAMLVAVLPRTAGFHRERPYTAANLAERVAIWSRESGYGSTEALVAAMTECGDQL